MTRPSVYKSGRELYDMLGYRASVVYEWSLFCGSACGQSDQGIPLESDGCQWVPRNRASLEAQSDAGCEVIHLSVWEFGLGNLCALDGILIWRRQILVLRNSKG